MLNDDVSPSRAMPDLPEFAERTLHVDVPWRADVLPDGRQVRIFGEPEAYREVSRPPGDVPPGFQAASGFSACESLLIRFGLEVSAWDLVHFALENGWCATFEDARLCSDAAPASLLEVVKAFGIPSHLEYGFSLEDLAHNIENGYGVCILANAGELYGAPEGLDQGEANYTVVVTGVVREVTADDLVGFYVHDSRAGKRCEFIDANKMQHAWVDTGGCQIVTEVT